MRKVIYSDYRWSAEINRNVKIEAGEAVFHQFGIGYEEFENGPGMFTTAIIELPNGEVLSLPVDQIKFIKE